MKIKKSSIYILLWILLSTGLLVLNQYKELKTIVLYGVVPAVFVAIIIFEKKLTLKSKAIKHLIYFSLWCSLSVFYTANMSLTINYISILIGNLVLWYSASRIVIKDIDFKPMVFLFIIPLFFHAIQGASTSETLLSNLEYERVTGLFDNSNALGFTMWYGAVSTVLLVLHLEKKVLLQLLLFGLILFFLFVLLQSGSRKNAFAFVAFSIILVYQLVQSKYKFYILILGIVTLIVYNIIDWSQIQSSALVERSTGEELESSGEYRLLIIKDGLNMFLSNPLFGVGLGSFTYYSSTGLMAHNDAIEILASTGIVGLLIYAYIYWAFYKLNRQLLKSDETYRLGAWSQAFLVGFIVLGMGRPTFLDPVAMLVLAFYYNLSRHQLKLINIKNHQNTINAHLPYNQHA